MKDLYIFVSHNVYDRDIVKQKPLVPTHPYYTNHIELIGVKDVYTREDIEKYSTYLCKTKSDRLLKLKRGSFLKTYGTGSSTDLYVYRLKQEDVDIVDAIYKNKERIKGLQIEINIICKKQTEEIKKINKEQDKLRKQTKIKI